VPCRKLKESEHSALKLIAELLPHRAVMARRRLSARGRHSWQQSRVSVADS
jgi:hypothetical protein